MSASEKGRRNTDRSPLMEMKSPFRDCGVPAHRIAVTCSVIRPEACAAVDHSAHHEDGVESACSADFGCDSIYVLIANIKFDF